MDTHLNQTLVLSCKDIGHIVRHYGLNYLMDTLIERLENAIKTFDPDQTAIPIRAGFHYDQPQNGLIEWMPLHKQGSQVMIKVVGYHPNNPVIAGLPTIISTISAYDTGSGRLVGLIDGVLLTALRTGAASAVASRFMAHPDSATLGLIGCGAQAVTQFHALSRVFELKRVLIYDIDEEAMLSFSDRCAAFAPDIDIVQTGIPEIVKASEILCTATSIEVGAGPLFENLETNPILHINAVGSDFPGKTELPPDLLRQCFVCPDFPAQAILEGECQQLAPKHIGPSIVEVVQNADAYAHVRDQRSVFDSTGWALEDQVAMEMFLECAADLGLGQLLEIENMTKDAKNPYHFAREGAVSLGVGE